MREANSTNGIPTTAERRTELAALVRDRGEAGAAEVLGINRATLARAMAGLPIHRGTHAQIAVRLAALVQP